jgi:ABC-type polar amino acid transport system ATPase subunit
MGDCKKNIAMEGGKIMTIQQRFLEANHLSSQGKMVCSEKRNIVIGPNGGGKSRFLRAVMSQYEDLGYAEHEIVFADFPMLTYKEENQKPSESYPAHNFFFSKSPTNLKNLMVDINLEENELVETLFIGKAQANEKKLWPELFPSFANFLKEVLDFQLDLANQLIIVKGENKNYNKFIEFLNKQASPGERNLFYMCVFLAALATHRKDDSRLVILLDEPESHMHPSKVARFIELIEEKLPNASLWVATHSVNLLPKFEFKEIVYIKDSKIQKRNSSMYRRVFDSLVGTSEDIETFLRDLIEWETCSFVTECLALPPTIANKKDDLQSSRIKEIVKDFTKDNKKIKILDFGAGEGRIGVMLSEMSNNKIEYYTYEVDPKKNREYFKKRIKRYYKGHITPKTIVRNGYFDLILLVNTLHEISPVEWISIFGKIFRLMSPSGYLFLCEAAVLHRGEHLTADRKSGKPYGPLVLDESSLKCLFNLDTSESFSSPDKRIVSAVIPKSGLSLFSQSVDIVPKEQIKNALKILRKSSYEKYTSLLQSNQIRNEDSNEKFTSGRKAAFYLTQYANAQIGLDLLEATPNTMTVPGTHLVEVTFVDPLIEKVPVTLTPTP